MTMLAFESTGPNNSVPVPQPVIYVTVVLAPIQPELEFAAFPVGSVHPLGVPQVAELAVKGSMLLSK